jgi:hypothetical protein
MIRYLNSRNSSLVKTDSRDNRRKVLLDFQGLVSLEVLSLSLRVDFLQEGDLNLQMLMIFSELFLVGAHPLMI